MRVLSSFTSLIRVLMVSCWSAGSATCAYDEQQKHSITMKKMTTWFMPGVLGKGLTISGKMRQDKPCALFATSKLLDTPGVTKVPLSHSSALAIKHINSRNNNVLVNVFLDIKNHIPGDFSGPFSNLTSPEVCGNLWPPSMRLSRWFGSNLLTAE